MIDNRLLKLKHFLEQQNYQFLLIDLSEYFEVSERQIGRILKKWQEDGFIEYIPASGRGNNAKIQLVQDVESLILDDVIKSVKDLSVEELQNFLELPFSEKSLHKLQMAVNNVILNNNEEQVFVPYDYLPKTIEPPNIVTTEEAQIVFQVYETLYRFTADGYIQRNLISYDEWVGDELHLYLKKEVSFSNGEMLVAEDVKKVLDTLRTNSLYTKLYNNIIDVQVVNNFKLVLIFETRPKLFEYSLAQRYSSIYKDVGDDYLLGTGPYAIANIDDTKVEMMNNPFYRGATPEVHTVTFTKDFDFVKSEYKSIQTKKISTQFGNEFILFNPFHKFTKKQRIFLADMLLESFREVVEEEIGVASPSKQYAPGDVTLKNGYVKVLVVDFNKDVYIVFRNKLKAFDIDVIFYEATNEAYINTNLLNIDVDFVWMFESYTLHQPFKTLDLLTHCKFQEWYGDFEDARQITDQVDYRPNESLKSLCNSFLRKIELKKYMIPIYEHEKYIELPATMKNIKEQSYGTIDFRMIINDKEE